MTQHLLTTAIAASLVLTIASAHAATDYPTKPITIIVAYAPGGMGDAFARILSERMTVVFKQPVIVDNKPGASGAIGARLLAKSAPDGYTLLLGQTGEIAVNQSAMKNPGYDALRDLRPVILVGDSPLVMVAPVTATFGTVAELSQALVARPGKLTYASSGSGTPGHLAAAAFATGAKADAVHVPYKGAGPALSDVLGAHVDFFFSSASAALPHIRSGKLKAIAMSGTSRSASMPTVPTVAESGQPGFSFSLWGGVFAPEKTPDEIVKTLNMEINKIIVDPQIKARLEGQGAVVRANTPEEFAAFVRNEAAKYGPIVKQAGVVTE